MAEETPVDVKTAVADVLKETGFKPEDAIPSREVDLTPAPARGEDGKFVSAGAKEEELAKEEEPEKKEEPEKEEEPEKAAAAEKDVKEKMVSEDDFRPTAEELEVINQSPELTKVYRSMVKGFTAKTSATAAVRKEAEAALNAVKVLKDDPDKAIRALVAARGGKLAEEAAVPGKEPPPPPQKLVVEKLQEKLAAKIGAEAAEVLAPALFDAVTEVTGEELAPIKQALDEGKRSAQEIATRASITNFGNAVIKDGGEWNEDIEKEMAQMIGKVMPGEGVTLSEFLGILHNNVVVHRSKVAKGEREVTRLQKAAKQDEPVRSVRTAPPVSPAITAGMDPKQATLAAVAQAKAELASRQ